MLISMQKDKQTQEIFELLCSYHPDGRKQTEDYNTALHFASKTKSKFYIRQLIDTYTINQQNKAGDTPLHIAIRYDNNSAAIELINQNANINIPNLLGQTSAHEVAKKENLHILEKLIKQHAKIDQPDKHGYTPSHIASLNGNTKTIKMLHKAGANTDTKDYYGNTQLTLASINGYLKTVQVLIELNTNTNENIDMAIIQAKKYKQSEVTQYLQKIHQEKTDCDKILKIQKNVLNTIKTNKQLNNELLQKAQKRKIKYTPYRLSQCNKKLIHTLANLKSLKPDKYKKIIEEWRTCEQKEQQELTRLEQQLKKMNEQHKKKLENKDEDENDNKEKAPIQ